MSSRRNREGTSRTTCDGDRGRIGVGQSRAEEYQAGDLPALRELERQQATQAVPDDHRRAPERIEAGDRIVEVGVQVERLEVGAVGPEMRAQVEGVALPATLGEVLQIALPDPRSGQLAVQQVQRPPPGAALGEPALDIEATLLDDDLVLAHRSSG